MDIHLRPATLADAPFLALVLMEAIRRDALLPDGSLKPELHATFRQIVPLARADDTLYSWRHGTIATLPDGTPVGGIIAYAGDRYRQLRLATFPRITDLLDFDPEQMEDEARPGEHYLDSLCVLPTHRGCGIGALLMQRWMQDAHSRHLIPTLAVYPDNEKAKALYRKMGFTEAGFMFIFGEDYLRMQNR